MGSEAFVENNKYQSM